MTALKFQSKYIYIFVFFALFLFSAFRYEVGCDWESYKNIFLNETDVVDLLYVIQSREPIFWLITGVLYNLNFSYLSLNIVSSAIFFAGIYILARRQPDPLSFLVLLFPILIINMPMSGVRQGAAIGFICIAFAAFIDKRPLKFLIWVIIASGMHISSIIFIILFPFASGRYNNTRLAITALLAAPCFIVFSFFESARWAFNTYVSADREAYGAVFRIMILALSGSYFLLCVKNKWLRTFPKDYSIVSLGSLGMIIIIFLIPISTIISDRFGYYLIPIQAMIFSRIPYLPFRVNHSINSALPYIGLFIVFIVWTKTSWHFQECYIPYKFNFLNLTEILNSFDILN